MRHRLKRSPGIFNCAWQSRWGTARSSAIASDVWPHSRLAHCGSVQRWAVGLCPGCGREAASGDGGGGGGLQGEGAHDAYGTQPTQAFRVDGDNIRFLCGLQRLAKYDKDTIPEALPRQRVREIRSMLLRFLEFHAGQCGRLRSLEFLESIKG